MDALAREAQKKVIAEAEVERLRDELKAGKEKIASLEGEGKILARRLETAEARAQQAESDASALQAAAQEAEEAASRLGQSMPQLNAERESRKRLEAELQMMKQQVRLLEELHEHDVFPVLEGCGDAAAAAELQEKFHSAVSRRGPQSFREGSAQSRRAGEKAAKVVAALEGVLRSCDGFGGPPRPF